MRGLDIFSGAGGSSVGARSAGVDMVGAIDMCPVATDTYRSNFPKTNVVTGRLEELDLAKLRREIGSVDVLLASPECTNHTCAKGAAPRDETSRATALYAVEYAKAFKPRWIVLENVVHMRPWSRYGELKRELKALGYHLAEQILDASDYGVPQTRRRLFLVGDRNGPPGVVRSKTPGPRKSVKSILDRPGIWATTPLRTERRAAGTLERAKRAFEALGDDASFLLVYYGSDGSGGWQPLTRPLRTITTVDRFALVEAGPEGSTMRMLQVPELRRAMGFDEAYRMDVGTRRDRVRLLGNGVCPPVMERVVGALTKTA
ncbi:DNA cytosine methyltransferase [Luteimonas sp. SDU82]|uniref:DNA cytosine methyltransferase n=1 Tax=Luteimonas sp. SDU82 TaxID=3422592 RepID=UPI003EB97512